MIKAYLFEPKSLTRGLKLMSGRIELSNATPPGTTQKGLGITVTRVGAAQYRVTFHDKFVDINAIHAQLSQPGTGAGNVVTVDYTNVDSGYFDLWISQSQNGNANDITANPEFYVQFTAIMKDTTAQ